MCSSDVCCQCKNVFRSSRSFFAVRKGGYLPQSTAKRPKKRNKNQITGSSSNAFSHCSMLTGSDLDGFSTVAPAVRLKFPWIPVRSGKAMEGWRNPKGAASKKCCWSLSVEAAHIRGPYATQSVKPACLWHKSWHTCRQGRKGWHLYTLLYICGS